MSLVGMGSYLGFSDLGCGCLSGEMEVTEVLSRRVTCSDFFLFFFFFFKNNLPDHSAEILLYYSSGEGGSRKNTWEAVIIILIRELVVS